EGSNHCSRADGLVGSSAEEASDGRWRVHLGRHGNGVHLLSFLRGFRHPRLWHQPPYRPPSAPRSWSPLEPGLLTVADSLGMVQDTTRSCYESWMRVPDHPDPIRVRWYAVPNPGAGNYELTDFSSSDWDEDPKSSDPELGEQSTVRSPFEDWRSCSGPPFPPPPRQITGAGFNVQTVIPSTP